VGGRGSPGVGGRIKLDEAGKRRVGTRDRSGVEGGGGLSGDLACGIRVESSDLFSPRSESSSNLGLFFCIWGELNSCQVAWDSSISTLESLFCKSGVKLELSSLLPQGGQKLLSDGVRDNCFPRIHFQIMVRNDKLIQNKSLPWDVLTNFY